MASAEIGDDVQVTISKSDFMNLIMNLLAVTGELEQLKQKEEQPEKYITGRFNSSPVNCSTEDSRNKHELRLEISNQCVSQEGKTDRQIQNYRLGEQGVMSGHEENDKNAGHAMNTPITTDSGIKKDGNTNSNRKINHPSDTMSYDSQKISLIRKTKSASDDRQWNEALDLNGDSENLVVESTLLQKNLELIKQYTSALDQSVELKAMTHDLFSNEQNLCQNISSRQNDHTSHYKRDQEMKKTNSHDSFLSTTSKYDRRKQPGVRQRPRMLSSVSQSNATMIAKNNSMSADSHLTSKAVFNKVVCELNRVKYENSLLMQERMVNIYFFITRIN